VADGRSEADDAAPIIRLARLITDTRRLSPIVVVTETGRPPASLVDVDRLRAAVAASGAAVSVLNRESAAELRRLLPAGWSVHGGAIRVFQPLPADHPVFCVWSPEDQDYVILRIAAALSPAGPAGQPTTTPPGRDPRHEITVGRCGDAYPDVPAPAGDQLDSGPSATHLRATPVGHASAGAELRAEAGELRVEELSFELADARRRQEAAEAKTARARVRARTAEAGIADAQRRAAHAEQQTQVALTELARLTERLEAAEHHVARLQAHTQALTQRLVTTADGVSSARAETAAARQEAAASGRAAAAAAAARDAQAEATRDARREIRRLTDTVDELRRRLHGQRIFSDPEQQARHEITHAYLATVPQAQRGDLVLRDYRFGPDFLTSLDRLAPPTRQRAVDIVIDVLTRRASTRPGREVRQHGLAGPAAAGQQSVRADGAAAWRCNIQDNTPQARRLLWWELPDGTVELGKIALHDDTNLTSRVP